MRHLIIVTGLLLSAFGCNKDNDRPAMQPASGTGERSAAASARDSIAEARCAREQRCDNVGDGKKYSSSQDCVARITADWKDDLNARECPRGVHHKQLDECLVAVRGEDCGNPFDTLSRVSACTKGQICAD